MTNLLLRWWGRAQKLPGGEWGFSRILGWIIPYTGSISPRVLEVRPRFARVRMRDRRRFRNHLRCIHAVAQLNLGEFTTGLAMTSQLSGNGRAIIKNLSIEFVKKARGTLVAECECQAIDDSRSGDHEILCTVKDRGGDVVSRVVARWLVGPKKESAGGSD